MSFQFAIKDRKDVLRKLNEIRVISDELDKGLFQQLYDTGFWHPDDTIKTDNGIVGKVIQDLVGPTLVTPVADYGLCELKSQTLKTDCSITICKCPKNYFDNPDSFAQSKVFNKLKYTVFVIFENFKVFEYRPGMFVYDHQIVDTYSLDLNDNQEIRDVLHEDYDKICKSEITNGKYLKLDNTSNGGLQWRLKPKSKQLIRGHDTMANNPYFQKGM